MSTPSSPEQPLSAEDETLARHREALRKRFPMPTPKPRKSRAPLAISTLLIIIGAGLVWTDPSYRTEHYSSTVGERRELDLVDGSKLVLDSSTRVEVSWHLRSRRVELSTGQALFDVSKTVFRPFEVDAGAARVTVLGTRFNVSREQDAVNVALMRGSVSVQSTVDPAQQQRLAPGQQLAVLNGQLQPTENADLSKILAWQERKLVFSHTPLSQAIEQIQRYRQAPIRLDDQSLANLPISGVFNTDKVDDLLDLLPHILPLNITRDTDGTLHITHRAAKK
ncbi:FecR family protein [Pseudomonas sp. CCC3.1]|uniref:FecR family protein n=1 Tax=Pseudomonas sp. CCC3.1 TaxID=3048607 RepID=UPI002AC981D3|nr:FecR domain-containing protein [Pseudomonas sp. CCC3.1]MEB0204524.1 FecR domain-containing protein [Pseudomonas sp. CCC3.1]WPX38835.1 FecR domain-containing protein [Pseudomonas sp. CCC3.1]